MFFLMSEKYNEKYFRVYRDVVLGVVKNKCSRNRKKKSYKKYLKKIN